MLSSETRWGVITVVQDPSDHATSVQKQAVILYFDLLFDQPTKQALLEWVDASITFRTARTPSDEVFVTDFYGPRLVQGNPHQTSVHQERSFSPQLGITTAAAGVDIAGMGRNENRDFQRTERWSFYGLREISDRGARRYDQILWRWLCESDEISDIPRKEFKAGVAITYDGVPLEMNLNVSGRLRSRTQGFLRMVSRSEGLPVVLDQPASRHPPAPLDAIAKELHDKLYQENLK